LEGLVKDENANEFIVLKGIEILFLGGSAQYERV